MDVPSHARHHLDMEQHPNSETQSNSPLLPPQSAVPMNNDHQPEHSYDGRPSSDGNRGGAVPYVESYPTQPESYIPSAHGQNVSPPHSIVGYPPPSQEVLANLHPLLAEPPQPPHVQQHQQKRSKTRDENGPAQGKPSKKAKVAANGEELEETKKKARKPPTKREKKRDTRECIEMYRDIPDPHEPVRINRQTTHSAPQVKISEDGLTFHNEKGYRMAKASHGVSQGCYYFEIKINEPLTPKGNLRIGWSQISGDLQGPCGFDTFSYSYRSHPASIFHASQSSQYGSGYAPGDIVGCWIHLGDGKSDGVEKPKSDLDFALKPTNDVHKDPEAQNDPEVQKDPEVQEKPEVQGKPEVQEKQNDRIEVAEKPKNKTNDEEAPKKGLDEANQESTVEQKVEGAAATARTPSNDVPSLSGAVSVPVYEPLPDPWQPGMPYQPVAYYGPRPRIPGSEIRFFKNGVDEGVAFRELYQGKYHPAFSSYMGGSINVNFGESPFEFPMPKGAKAIAECFIPKPKSGTLVTETESENVHPQVEEKEEAQ